MIYESGVLHVLHVLYEHVCSMCDNKIMHIQHSGCRNPTVAGTWQQLAVVTPCLHTQPLCHASCYKRDSCMKGWFSHSALHHELASLAALAQRDNDKPHTEHSARPQSSVRLNFFSVNPEFPARTVSHRSQWVGNPLPRIGCPRSARRRRSSARTRPR